MAGDGAVLLLKGFAFADYVLREKAKYHGIVTDIDKTFVEISSLSSNK